MNQLGFTLVELMIAVAIMAIIATIGVVAYSGAQSVGRDARRKQDLRSIAFALEIYYQKNKAYPPSSSCVSLASNWCTSDKSNPWIPALGPDYINNLPKDPLNELGNNPWWVPGGGYGYWGGLCGTTPYYALLTTLENAGDQDAHAKKNYKWCGGGPMLWHKQLFAITSQ